MNDAASQSPQPAWSDLVCARVLHDLVGPVGAIGNGLELFEEMGGGSDALGLLGDSARQTADRLKLFRLAYGTAGFASAATIPAIWTLLTPVLADKRVTLAPLPDPVFADLADNPAGVPGTGKTAALAAIALSDTALRGGTLTLGIEDEGGPSAAVTLTLAAGRIAPEALAGLEPTPARPTGERAVPARLAQEAAAKTERVWSAETQEGWVRLILRRNSDAAAIFSGAG